MQTDVTTTEPSVAGEPGGEPVLAEAKGAPCNRYFRLSALRAVKVAAVVALLCWPVPASADAWRCEAATAIVCSHGQCQQGQPSVWLILDFDRNTYDRCDNKGCDQYQMMVVPSGIFVSIVYNPSSIFKATADGSEYIEVATLGLATYSQFGACTVH